MDSDICQRAIRLVPRESNIAIQDVQQVRQWNQPLPPFLKGVPTLYEPSTKAVYQGTDAIQQLQVYANFFYKHVHASNIALVNPIFPWQLQGGVNNSNMNMSFVQPQPQIQQQLQPQQQPTYNPWDTSQQPVNQPMQQPVNMNNNNPNQPQQQQQFQPQPQSQQQSSSGSGAVLPESGESKGPQLPDFYTQPFTSNIPPQQAQISNNNIQSPQQPQQQIPSYQQQVSVSPSQPVIQNQPAPPLPKSKKSSGIRMPPIIKQPQSQMEADDSS